MRREVIVRFSPEQEFSFNLEGVEPMSAEAARWWLDDQFVKQECTLLRASGKVLIADKVLAIASAVGAAKFADAGFAGEFARAASAALDKPSVRVDLPALTVAY